MHSNYFCLHISIIIFFRANKNKKVIIEVFAIVKLPKMLSTGGTLEVFENKILGPDVKLFLFLFCYVANVRTQQKQSLVKTE